MSSENVDLVKRFIDVFNSSDSIYALADFLAPDVEFHEPPEQPGSSVLRGREAALPALGAGDLGFWRGAITPEVSRHVTGSVATNQSRRAESVGIS